MKKNIIILSSVIPGPNEALLWNSIFKDGREKFRFLFFSPVDFENIQPDYFLKFDWDKIYFPKDSHPQYESGCSENEDLAKFEHIWGRFIPIWSNHLAFSWLAFWIEAVRHFEPAAVFVWNGFHLPEAALLRVCEARDIPAYFAERGPFARTFALDRQGINYNSDFNKRADHYRTEPDDEFIDRFRKIYFKNGVSNWQQPDEITSLDKFRQKHGIPRDKVIVFFPLQVEKDTNSKLYSPHFESVLDAFKFIVSSTAAYSNKLFLLVKIHPMQENRRSYKAVSMPHGQLVDDAHIFDCVRYSDAIISINSSAAVEGLLLKKPSLIIGQSILENNQSVLKLRDKSEITGLIDSLISKCSVIDMQENTAYFSALLKRYLYTADPAYLAIGLQPASRILNEIDVISNSSKKLDSGEFSERAVLFEKCLQIAAPKFSRFFLLGATIGVYRRIKNRLLRML